MNMYPPASASIHIKGARAGDRYSVEFVYHADRIDVDWPSAELVERASTSGKRAYEVYRGNPEGGPKMLLAWSDLRPERQRVWEEIAAAGLRQS